MTDTFPSLRLELDAAPAYELLMVLSVLSGGENSRPEPLPDLRALLQRVPADLLKAIERFTGGSDKVFPHVVPLAYAAPPPRAADDLIAYLDGLDAFDLYLHLLGYHMRYFRRATPPEVIRAAAAGDGEARGLFMAGSYPDDAPWQAALHRLLSLGALEAKAGALTILRRARDEVFEPYERAVMPILRRDLEAKRLLNARVGPERTIEAATHGIEYAPEPGITRVLLIPSCAIVPWVHTLDHGDLKIFCYSVAEESITGREGAPPARLVALTKALGDERRLEILRLLAAERLTLAEIAGRFGVPKTSMHHHLVILRSAGLVRMRSSDRTYTLRPEVIPDVSALLSAYVQGEER
jgi:DNA-binding transcriptional ArsR family regulator